jgi:hypothetical protein
MAPSAISTTTEAATPATKLHSTLNGAKDAGAYQLFAPKYDKSVEEEGGSKAKVRPNQRAPNQPDIWYPATYVTLSMPTTYRHGTRIRSIQL